MHGSRQPDGHAEERFHDFAAFFDRYWREVAAAIALATGDVAAAEDAVYDATRYLGRRTVGLASASQVAPKRTRASQDSDWSVLRTRERRPACSSRLVTHARRNALSSLTST
jgi:hypothetical protein